MKTLPFLVLAAWFTACTPAQTSGPPPAPAPDLGPAAAVLPVLNNAFPFRVEASPDPRDPLGTRRVPTDRLVVTDTSAPLPGGLGDLGAGGPGLEVLGPALTAANLQPVAWPGALADTGPALSRRRLEAKASGEPWWPALARLAPMASARVTLTRPGFAPDGRSALVGAWVETASGAPVTYLFRLEQDAGAWVVTHSWSR